MNPAQSELNFDDERRIIEGKIEKAFKRFHENNPHVYDQLVVMSKRLKSVGHKRYGIAGLFEMLRYNHAISTSGDKFKLSNNYRALYSRAIMKDHPELDGFFKIKQRRS